VDDRPAGIDIEKIHSLDLKVANTSAQFNLQKEHIVSIYQIANLDV